MNIHPLFITELLLSMSISLLALLLLRGVLESILVDLCGNATRAKFWCRFTQLMLLIGPLLGALLLSNGSPAPIDSSLARDTLRNVLTGTFATLAGVGWVIWNSIPENGSSTPSTFDSQSTEEGA